MGTGPFPNPISVTDPVVSPFPIMVPIFVTAPPIFTGTPVPDIGIYTLAVGTIATAAATLTVEKK
jgi:hypothetical protein